MPLRACKESGSMQCLASSSGTRCSTTQGKTGEQTLGKVTSTNEEIFCFGLRFFVMCGIF